MSSISGAKQSSRYKRLQRFFRGFNFDFNQIATFVFKLFSLKDGKWYLTIDRTDWQLGKTVINILMLAIIYEGVAIPIYWSLFRKKGNSNTKERIELLEKFINNFGKDKISGLLGDREFIGGKWFEYLKKHKIPFFIRIKTNAITTNAQGKEVDIRLLFLGLKPGEYRILEGERKLWGNELYLAGIRLTKNGELLIVTTNESPENALSIYLLRWKIETLFASLKTRGFRLEETHIINLVRLKKILALLTITFCWAYKTGEWRIKNHEEIKIKKHGRKEKSIFRHGLDWIRKEVWDSNISIEHILWKLLQPIFIPPISEFVAESMLDDCVFKQSIEQK